MMVANAFFLASSPPRFRSPRAVFVASSLQRGRTCRSLSLRRCAARAASEIADDETPKASSAAASSATTAAPRRRRRTTPPQQQQPVTTSPHPAAYASASGQKKTKGADATAILWLEFEEAALGCVKEVSLFVRRPCRGCLGARTADGAAPVPCERCRGRGKVQTSRTAGIRRVGVRVGSQEEEARERRWRKEKEDDGSSSSSSSSSSGGGEAAATDDPFLSSSSPFSSSSSSSSSSCCPLCRGSGNSSATPWCPDCGGEGSVEVPEATRVRVPAGATDATALRIRGAGHSRAPARAPVRLKGALLLRPEEDDGEGEEGLSTAAAAVAATTTRGDAYILCCVAAAAAQREWSRRGLDVVAPLSLSPFDAVLGVPSLPVRTLRGLRRVRVPSGTQHGDELVLKGEGAGGGGDEGGGGEGGEGRRSGGERASSAPPPPPPSSRSSRSSSPAAAASSAAGDHVLVVRLNVPEKVSSSDRGLLLRLREIAQRV